MSQSLFANYGGPSNHRLAIASAVTGMVSLLTCSFFLVGAVAGIALGVAAILRVKKDPEQYKAWAWHAPESLLAPLQSCSFQSPFLVCSILSGQQEKRPPYRTSKPSALRSSCIPSRKTDVSSLI